MAQDVASLAISINANTAKFEADLKKAKLSAEEFGRVVADQKAFREWVDLGKEAAKVAAAAKPPTDKWRESVETLNRAFEQGAISQEKFKQAMRGMNAKLPALDTGDFKTVSMPSADALGGAMKWAAIAGALKGALDFTNSLIENVGKVNARFGEGTTILERWPDYVVATSDAFLKSIPIIGGALSQLSDYGKEFVAWMTGDKTEKQLDELKKKAEEIEKKNADKLEKQKQEKDKKEKDRIKELQDEREKAFKQQQDRIKQIKDLVEQTQEMNLTDRQKTIGKAYKLMPGQGVIDELNKQFDIKDAMERAKKVADEQKKLDEETKRKQEQMEKQLADKRKQYIEQSMTPYEKYREQLNEIRQLFGNDPKTKNQLEERLSKKYFEDNFKQGKLNFDSYGLKGAFETAGINQEFRKSFISFNEKQDEDKKQTKILQEIATNTKAKSTNSGFNR